MPNCYVLSSSLDSTGNISLKYLYIYNTVLFISVSVLLICLMKPPSISLHLNKFVCALNHSLLVSWFSDLIWVFVKYEKVLKAQLLSSERSLA